MGGGTTCRDCADAGPNPAFKAPAGLLETSLSVLREVTDLEQLQYDRCECSTKSQAAALSASSSSQVPLVVAENFRLEEERKQSSDTVMLC